MIKPVILCGGSGTRLWPLSRQDYPKQFIQLIGETSLFQATLLRARRLCPDVDPMVICGEQMRFLAAEQAQQVGVNCEIVLEPCGRNTAPAITLAALQCDAKTLLYVMPADHLLSVDEHLITQFNAAVPYAEKGHAVTFGILPTRPETGYGYIQQGQALDGNICQVTQFVEKPDVARAQAYCDAGTYVWNSGMFLFQVGAYLKAIETYAPDVLKAVTQATQSAVTDLDFVRIDQTAFAQSPNISVDYAVMENIADAVVVPLDTKWSDVGSWDAVCDASEPDENGNVLLGDVLSIDSQDNYVHGDSRLIATLGVSNHIIVDTADALLVADKRHAQQVRAVVKMLSDRDEEKGQSKCIK